MSSFTKPLKGEILDDGTMKLSEPFAFYESEDTSKIVNVPAGFITDFASVPQIFQCFISPIGKHSKPAVLHDYLCAQAHLGYNTRKYADKIFLESMEVKNVKFLTKWTLYLSVRLFAIFKGYK